MNDFQIKTLPIISKLKKAIAAKKEIHRFTSAFADHVDEVPTGLVCLNICQWPAFGRTMTAEGRSQLQKADAEESELLALAETFGRVEHNGDGSGDGYTITCFLIHPFALTHPKTKAKQDEPHRRNNQHRHKEG